MTPDLESPYILARYQGERPPAPAWFEAAMGDAPERSHFSSDGAEIELLTWGERGRPGLLFLHGNGAHADWWSFIAPFFARDWRCAALSWSGMGRSAYREDGYTIDIFAREAQDAIAAAGLDAGGIAPVIIGHSMGGMVGIDAAAGEVPVRGLVLVDTPLNMDPELIKAVRARAPKGRTAHRPFNNLIEGLAQFRLSPPQPCANDFIADYIARHSLIEQGGAFFWRFDPRRITMQPDRAGPPLADVRCPVAFIYGARSSLMGPDGLARTLAVLPEGTPTIEIPDAAHHVPIDQPLALVAALRTLLTVWL